MISTGQSFSYSVQFLGSFRGRSALVSLFLSFDHRRIAVAHRELGQNIKLCVLNVRRYSQLAPTGMFTEKNTGTNLPAQIDLLAAAGNEYHFQFMAKGGGSANKTFLFQKTKALLNEKALGKVHLYSQCCCCCCCCECVAEIPQRQEILRAWPVSHVDCAKAAKKSEVP